LLGTLVEILARQGGMKMWMLFGMVTVASVFVLGFVLGRIWEIRLQMRLEQAKQRGLELTEHEITEAAVQH